MVTVSVHGTATHAQTTVDLSEEERANAIVHIAVIALKASDIRAVVTVVGHTTGCGCSSSVAITVGVGIEHLAIVTVGIVRNATGNRCTGTKSVTIVVGVQCLAVIAIAIVRYATWRIGRSAESITIQIGVEDRCIVAVAVVPYAACYRSTCTESVTVIIRVGGLAIIAVRVICHIASRCSTGHDHIACITEAIAIVVGVPSGGGVLRYGHGSRCGRAWWSGYEVGVHTGNHGGRVVHASDHRAWTAPRTSAIGTAGQLAQQVGRCRIVAGHKSAVAPCIWNWYCGH